jgi:hypothetical protein
VPDDVALIYGNKMAGENMEFETELSLCGLICAMTEIKFVAHEYMTICFYVPLNEFQGEI